MRRTYIILIALAVFFSTILLLGCGKHNSTSSSIQGNTQVSENIGNVEGTTWYTDTNPDQRLITGVHLTFSTGGQTYSTDSRELGWYYIELPSSSEPGISCTIHATAEGCRPYDGEISVVTGATITKDIVLVLTTK
jgi:hypothetical protein